MSAASSDLELTRRADLLPGRAGNSASALGKSLRYHFRGSFKVLHIHFTTRLNDVLRFTQARSSSSSAPEDEAQGPLRQLSGRRSLVRKKPDKSLGNPLRVLTTLIVLFIVSQLLAYMAVETVLSLKTGVYSSLENSAAAQFFYLLLAQGLSIYWVYRILKKRGLRLSAIGLGRLARWSDLWKAVLGFGTFYGLLIIAGLLIKQFLPAINLDQPQDIGFNYLNTYRDSILAFTALVILAPLGEEILMRGYLYSGLRAHWRFLPSLLATGILFGAAHLMSGDGSGLLWAAGIHTFILSAVLVYLREKTGALYASIMVHIFNNLMAFIVYF
ncbi:MAG: type II CAAX endopeptidase family protein [Candidatus Saccharimonadales bacterium]